MAPSPRSAPEGGADRAWWSVRFGTVARAVVWIAALMALGLWAWPSVRQAIHRAELLGAEPPRRLPVPVAGVAPADVGPTFGDPRDGGARSHRGLDIFASRRTPVTSATRGFVLRRGTNPLGGRTVIVLGPGGWRHYYAHLEQWAGHSEGDRVEVGEVIGFVGTSGNAPRDAPHLHYAIYADGEAIDPYPFLTGGAGPEPATGESSRPAAP